MNKYAVGIDLGGTRVKIGLVSDGVIIAKNIIAAQSAHGLAASLPLIKQLVAEMLDANNVSTSNVTGIGIGFPGLVNPLQKKILSTNAKYDDALDIDMEAWVKEHFNLPVFIDNDARMAAVGEWKYGAATDTDNVVVMTIGTGVGTSAIIEGKLLRGKHFQAGCLGGHFSVHYNGRLCTCGNIGCMEAHAATWSIKEIITEHPQFSTSILAHAPVIDFEHLFNAATGGDALAKEVKQDCLDVWSAGIISLIHAYDPEVIVIGGGVMNSESAVIPYLTQKVHQHAWTPWGKVQLRPTKLLSDAGILGAVYCLENKV